MGKERYGSDDRVDGRETVRNSMGRGPWGRSKMGSYDMVDGGEPWEIAWGAPVERSDTGVRTEWTEKGNRGKWLGESSGGKERYGSVETVDGGETDGN